MLVNVDGPVMHQVGLISDGGGLYFLPRLIGPYRAKELFFSGKPLTAAKAHEYGIVNHVFPQDNLEAETKKIAISLSKGPGKAFGMMKKIADQAAVSSLQEILEQERITLTMMVTTEGHIEGITAFKEKRRPSFKG